MAGHGAPALPPTDAGRLQVAVVAASWHQTVMDGLVDGARRGCAAYGVEPAMLRVPGSFELPAAAARLARDGEFDAIVALGVVVRGGTPHFEYVCQAATAGLTSVSVNHAIPVGFGVLTCDTVEQALDRAGLPGSAEDKGFEAASAAIATAMELRQLLSVAGTGPHDRSTDAE